MADHYETLQFSPNADRETVDRVYRLLAKRYHPDNPASGDARLFAEVRAAYEILRSLPRTRLLRALSDLEAREPGEAGEPDIAPAERAAGM